MGMYIKEIKSPFQHFWREWDDGAQAAGQSPVTLGEALEKWESFSSAQKEQWRQSFLFLHAQKEADAKIYARAMSGV